MFQMWSVFAAVRVSCVRLCRLLFEIGYRMRRLLLPRSRPTRDGRLAHELFRDHENTTHR